MTTVPGPPGTQPASVHGVVVLVTRAAGWLPMRTVNMPVIMVNGSAGWGTGVGTGAGGWMGAWQWGESCLTMSPTRAAAGILILLLFAFFWVISPPQGDCIVIVESTFKAVITVPYRSTG